jgi:hypothetical protein
MVTNSSTTRFSYRVEPNPNGGLIARPSDPSMPTIEGATTEEVQQKIQAKLTEMIDQQLPTNFKIGGMNVTVKSKVNVVTRTAPGLGASPSSASMAQEALPAGNLPITSSDRLGTILRTAAAVLALLALVYFMLRR